MTRSDHQRPRSRSRRLLAPRWPSLRDVVGDVVYSVWLKMLGELVPSGRTHRLAVLVAGMLEYAAGKAARQRMPEEDSASWLLREAVEDCDPAEYESLLSPLVERLFTDAGVKWSRVSSKGERYSVIEHALTEFADWYNYQ